MAGSYDDILKASNEEYVREIFYDGEGNLSIDKENMKDIISN